MCGNALYDGRAPRRRSAPRSALLTCYARWVWYSLQKLVSDEIAQVERRRKSFGRRRAKGEGLKAVI